jgi:hypothetical protein
VPERQVKEQRLTEVAAANAAVRQAKRPQKSEVKISLRAF